MAKISVAMTTYNGEKYLYEQLYSLVNQKRKPDEVIICDDGSTDKTIEIINSFINNNNLQSSWKIYINKSNKGYTKNFLDCARMTTGDIIFFSDQDDIWHSEKIFTMTNNFEKNSKIKAMSCTISVINIRGEKINTLFNKFRMGNGKLKKIDFTTQVKNNISVGLTLALRREILDFIRPIILNNSLPFDVPVGLFTSIDNGYYILGIPLVYRRVHSNNVSAPKYTLKSRLLNVEKHIEGRVRRIALYETCLEEFEKQISIRDKENLMDAVERLKKSILFLKERNKVGLFFDLFTMNPMINRLIVVTNLACAIFGDYSVSNSVKEQMK